MEPSTFKCCDCGETKPINTVGASGYAMVPEGKVCYVCCATRDAEVMKAGKPIVLYWLPGRLVTNWPGTLALPAAFHRTGRHNIGRQQTTVYFRDLDGNPWSGRNIGDSQILRCRPITERTWRRA